MTIRQSLACSFLAFVVLTAIFILYLPGTYGALYYDDYNNLNGLSDVRTFDDAKNFVLNGTAGPLGRPLALSSFLPHAQHWPESRLAILRTNAAIHVANATLLGLVAMMILRLRGADSIKACWIALGTATLWATMPILASSSLIAIQRMTTLAAFFSILGLLGFVGGYWLRRRRPQLAFIVQFGALGFGTLLGVYTKETAALTPIFALLIDRLLLGHRRFPGNLHLITSALFFSALIFLLWYLSPFHLDWFAINDLRGWSAWERLQYQVVLLWEYLRLSVAPLPAAFGPFYDHRSIDDFSSLQSLIAAATWIAITLLFTWIYFRLKNPWPLFALLWFFTGHLLESTVLGLELVFEHRNYLAVFGIAFAVALSAAHAPGNIKRAAPVFLIVLIAINSASLLAVTSLWGNQRQAAERWAERYPGSSRAALHAAFIETGDSDEGIAAINNRLIKSEQKRNAIRILDRTALICPDCTDVRFQALLLACTYETNSLVRDRFDNLLHVLRSNGRVNISVADGFFVLDWVLGHNACPPLQPDDILQLMDAVKRRGPSVERALSARILFVGAKIHYDQGRLGEAQDILSNAEQIAPEALPVLQFQVFIYERLGDMHSAYAAIARRRTLNRVNTEMTDPVLDTLEFGLQESTPIHPKPN